MFITLGMVASIFFVIMIFAIQRDMLLVFPSIFLSYLNVDLLILCFIVLVGLMDNNGLFCSSRDLIYTNGPGNATAFCTISGFTFNYAILQACIWITMHALFLFWGVAFPFNYRQLRVTNRMRHAHIICIVLGLLIPLPTGLLPLIDGFVITSLDGIIFVCLGQDTDVTFYTLILPLSILLCLTSIFLTLMFWIIFKDFVLKKLISGKKVGKVGKAQFYSNLLRDHWCDGSCELHPLWSEKLRQ